ncbi:hypothetical protein D9M73_262260 [compost metagenome]
MATDAHVQVAIGVGVAAVVLFVGDVDAAGEGHLAIHHHQLAVGTQVQPRALERLEQLARMEPGHLAAGVQQRLQEAVADA